MRIDLHQLQEFEANLNPSRIEKSAIPATVLGYGEISSIFQIGNQAGVAFKRMPLFREEKTARNYEQLYRLYCDKLREAGLTLPEDETVVLQNPDGRWVLYIAQEQFPQERFGHRLIHWLPEEKLPGLIETILTNIEKVWLFNAANRPEVEISLDAQLSNWVVTDDQVYFVDTSTPLMRVQGREQLDPELLLQSAPGFLRWILRLFFLDDVMNRYYDRRLVYVDFVANLNKEQRPELIPEFLRQINRLAGEKMAPITEEEVAKYYNEDKLIWTLFLAFRRIDRFVTTRIRRRRYEFILPGKIKR